MPAIGGRQMHIHQLNGFKFFKHSPGSQALGQGSQFVFERHLQTVSHKRHKNVRLDSSVTLMRNGSYGQIVFALLEHLLDLGQLNVLLP